MSLQLPERSTASTARLRRLGLILGISFVALAGCSSDNEAGRLAMPDPITTEGENTLALWQGAWIAALITGGVVWGLIFYSCWRFRRRSDDEVPIQTRYNLPLEIFYTVFPIIMVVVFFAHTVRVQNLVLDDSEPDNVVYVVGQQWSWTFNYPDAVEGKNVFESGTGADIPDLYVPVDQTTRFELRSPDVIHDFGVPGFLLRMDVVPGLENQFQVTPKTIGVYRGACYEFCGVYHSRMLFHVHVVSQDDYDAYLQDQYDAGFSSEEPVCGGTFANTPKGLDNDATEEVCAQ